MKSTAMEVKTRKKEYPYLGIKQDSGAIVLFTAPKTGLLVKEGKSEGTLGLYKENFWKEELYDFYEGEVELSND